MGWLRSIQSLPLRGKVALTLAGTVVILVGVATTFSFRYWEGEALRAAEQQALLAASATRSTLESSLRSGAEGALRRHLLELTEGGPTVAARVYDGQGRILYSAVPSEEGSSRPEIWIPEPTSLPRGGVAHPDESGSTVRVFLPLATSRGTLLEVTSSVAPLRAAMRRGATLGLGLALGSILAVAIILGAMLEREVVTPLHRVEDALASETGRVRDEGDEVRGIRASLDHLLERERAAEERAAAREGFAEVGQLAAEMAHEFKRPLASIRSALDMLDQEYRLDGSGRAVMTSVNQQLAHLSETMQDLFSLARPVEVEGEQIQLREVLDDALVEFAGHPGASRVRVVREYGEGVPPVLGEARRLRQAFGNLMINAMEAMPDGGTLTLRTEETPQGWVRASVHDTGPGIPPDQVERILLPFYSTKPQGTGLGLPLVARVVAAHGGEFRVDSNPEDGTTMQVLLPPFDPQTAPETRDA